MQTVRLPRDTGAWRTGRPPTRVREDREPEETATCRGQDRAGGEGCDGRCWQGEGEEDSSRDSHTLFVHSLRRLPTLFAAVEDMTGAIACGVFSLSLSLFQSVGLVGCTTEQRKRKEWEWGGKGERAPSSLYKHALLRLSTEPGTLHVLGVVWPAPPLLLLLLLLLLLMVTMCSTLSPSLSFRSALSTSR